MDEIQDLQEPFMNGGEVMNVVIVSLSALVFSKLI